MSGNFTDSNQKRQVIEWNRTSLKIVDSSISTLNAMSITDICEDNMGNLFASTLHDASSSQWKVVKWNNTSWQNLLIDSLNSYYTIEAMCSDVQGNIYVATMTSNPNSKSFIAKWDGSFWTTIASSSILNGRTRSLCTDIYGNLYAAGNFSNSSQRKYVAKWDGNSWSEIGSGVNVLNANDAIYNIICDSSGNIFASGAFTNTFGYKYVAKWDGNSWTELGANVNPLNADESILTILKTKSGNILTAGRFRKKGKVYVAQWNGVSWSQLGDSVFFPLNITGHISTLFEDSDGSIYAGGNFTNNYSIRHIAVYANVIPSHVLEQKTSTVTIYPNPTNDYFNISDLQNSLSEVEIFNLNGQMVLKTKLSNTREDKVNIELLPFGLYVVEIVTKEASKHRLRLVKY